MQIRHKYIQILSKQQQTICFHSFFSYISRFRAPERITGETAYCFTHLMAAIEFIEKMDRNALKISEESYETFMEAAIQEFNQRPIPDSESQDSLETSFNEKLDIAEAKAEELFIKAKEVFKVTGERANQAFSSFKDSNLAKKSMEKINKFWKDIRAQEQDESKADAKEATQEDFESQLARAVSLSLIDDPIGIQIESATEEKTVEEVKSDDQVESCDNINDYTKDNIIDEVGDKNIK